MADDAHDEWYVPPEWEAESSPVPGMSRGEFERIAEQILWFSRFSLEDRLRSLARHRAEQRWFERLEVLGHAR